MLYDFIITRKEEFFLKKVEKLKKIMAEPDVEAPSSSSDAVELVAKGN